MEENILINVSHSLSGVTLVSALIEGQLVKHKYSDMEEWEAVKHFIKTYTDFKFMGSYTWSNACGCFVEFSDCGDGARLLHEVKGGYEITEWLEVVYDAEAENEDYEFVIDKGGYEIPTGFVMNVNC